MGVDSAAPVQVQIKPAEVKVSERNRPKTFELGCIGEARESSGPKSHAKVVEGDAILLDPTKSGEL